MLRLRRSIPILSLLFASAFVACSDDPADPATGFTAQGVELTSGSRVITANGQVLTGDTVTVASGASVTFGAQFITADGQRGLPTTSEYSLRVTVADTTVATVSVAASWNVLVNGIATNGGTTTMTVALLKNGTAVYTSPAIRVVVTGVASPEGLKTGDTLVYSVKPRDVNNAPDPANATTQQWVVLETGLSFQAKTEVMKIDRVEQNSGGTTVARDTVYMQIAADGSVYLFDEVRKQFMRQGGVAAQLAAALPQIWIKVANTTQTSATTWSSFSPDSITVKNLTIPGSPLPADLLMYGNAKHIGTLAQTVPAGTYSNSRRTEQMLHLKVTILVTTALDDSVAGQFDASQTVGLVGWSYNTKELKVATNSEVFYGQDAVLQSVKRK